MLFSQAVALLTVLASVAVALPTVHPPKDPFLDMDPKHVKFNSPEFWDQYNNVWWDGLATRSAEAEVEGEAQE